MVNKISIYKVSRVSNRHIQRNVINNEENRLKRN